MNEVISAEGLLRKFAITDPSEIDLETIAFDCGAEVRDAPLKGCAAHIIGFADRAVITVDRGTSPRRRRYSVAHELGHWLRHRGRIRACEVRDLDKPWSALDPESVANAFAADLTMPAYLFRPRADAEPISFKTVTALADEFVVSRCAAAIRLVDLGSYDAMILRHDSNGARIWFHGSQRIDGKLWPIKMLSPDSDAFDILKGGRGSSWPLKVDADDWISHPRARNYEIKEHSIPYRGDVLTLLWWEDSSMADDLVG